MQIKPKSFLQRKLIITLTIIIILVAVGVTIGGVTTSWKFGSHNTSSGNNPEVILNKEQVKKDIKSYLPNAGPWFSKKYVDNNSLTKVIFTLHKDSIVKDNKQWKAVIDPDSKHTADGSVSLALNWNTSKSINNKDIDKEINDDLKYSGVAPSAPMTSTYFLSHVNDYLKANTNKWLDQGIEIDNYPIASNVTSDDNHIEFLIVYNSSGKSFTRKISTSKLNQWSLPKDYSDTIILAALNNYQITLKKILLIKRTNKIFII